jgi:HSP20 family molecular chaperone IbpA
VALDSKSGATDHAIWRRLLHEVTITDSAEARFKDGVLEVTLQAPRGRKLEIRQ